MTLPAVIAYHADQQSKIIRRNADPKTRSAADLMQGLRHGLAAWALAEATTQQIMAVVEAHKTSRNN